MDIKKLIIQHKWLKLIIIVSVISSLRSLFMPIYADEITYNKLAENLLNGKYYLKDYPSTVTPVIPLLFAFFKIKTLPVLGFILHKLFNVGLTVFALRYVYLFIKKQEVNPEIALAVVALTAVNPIAVNYFSSLYPEALLFFCFWGCIYYATSDVSSKNLLKMLLFFLVLILTRYVYAVLGLLVILTFIRYLKNNSRFYLGNIIKYSIVVLIPIILWIKYIYNIEQNNLSEISYFDRFKIDSPILYNIKCGLGLIQHHEVGKINGIPAFASLFIPITGFRHFMLSTFFILAFILGFIVKTKTYGLKMLFLAIILVLLGFVFAGTGFSRYWLVLLPGFFLGFYFLLRKLKLKDMWFIYGAQAIALVYILNEIRLDIMVLNNHY